MKTLPCGGMIDQKRFGFSYRNVWYRNVSSHAASNQSYLKRFIACQVDFNNKTFFFVAQEKMRSFSTKKNNKYFLIMEQVIKFKTQNVQSHSSMFFSSDNNLG